MIGDKKKERRKRLTERHEPPPVYTMPSDAELLAGVFLLAGLGLAAGALGILAEAKMMVDAREYQKMLPGIPREETGNRCLGWLKRKLHL